MFEDLIGQYRLRELNERGVRLVEFVEEKNCSDKYLFQITAEKAIFVEVSPRYKG